MNNSELVTILNDLAETCKDGELGFSQCAGHAVDDELKTAFRQRAADCRAAALTLQELVRVHGGHADKSGSLTGALHRGWVGVQSFILDKDEDKVILEACNRGEAVAKARYVRALAQPLPENVRLIVQRQYESLLQSYAGISALLARYRLRSEG
ncbi:MAG: PA2169 family four-helix-bundle protein [Paludibacterium sp.]|uniref:ferritin-like domain-containing protein n=1 Tax=Paludibacterium sp. TaxID=1917523 RepID=UPI0025FA77F2|nr:PA2169 family four-helix-bundle protein [Paludibacterium sp.]MBV8047595.1 PA2169 family four-helix-bundle protein [Paludibacterium sp.]MBV8646888.1 PA2169 family four-helix-bundle protein [Paludibacterium sp.]